MGGSEGAILKLLLLTVCALLLSGCVTPRQREIKVIRSKTEINVQTLEVNKGDVMICDNERCRVVQP